MSLPPVSAIVVAAGSGVRFGGERPKQLALLAGKPVLSHCLATLEASPLISEIILLLPQDWLTVIEAEAVRPFHFSKVKCLVGGRNRTDSSRRGLAASKEELLLFHDGVRPFLSHSLIEEVARGAWEDGAALTAVPVEDTLKRVEQGRVVATVDRQDLWRAQTPQGFRREILTEAFDLTFGLELPDDIGLVEILGVKARIVPGDKGNIKITTAEDLDMASRLMAPEIRVGHGYDLHRLVPGRSLFLGCVEIPFDRGLLGHSDADVLAHALADACLGAAGLGDIGVHFPDTEAEWAGVSGEVILEKTMKKVRAAGFELVYADLTLIGEQPKIGPYRQAMNQALAQALGVTPDQVNTKATTTEGLGPTGDGQALAAWATATLT